MRYGQIIQRAAQVTWRNKVLWVYGIALALFGGVHGGGGGSGFQFSFGQGDIQRWARRMPSWPGMSVDWAGLAAALLALLGVILVLGLLWAIVGIVVRYTSMGALIGLTAEIEAGETPTFGSGLRRGWSRLLRLFAIALIIGVAGLAVGLVLALLFVGLGAAIVLPAIAMFAAGQGWVALGIAWLVLLGLGWVGLLIGVAILVSIPFTVVREYAYRAAVLRELGVFDALGRAWCLFRTRLKQSAGMWLVLTAIQLGLALLLLPILIVFAAGLGMSFAALLAAARSAWPVLLIGAPLALLGGVALLVGSGIYTTFESVAWTLFYLELEPEPEA